MKLHEIAAPNLGGCLDSFIAILHGWFTLHKMAGKSKIYIYIFVQMVIYHGGKRIQAAFDEDTWFSGQNRRCLEHGESAKKNDIEVGFTCT